MRIKIIGHNNSCIYNIFNILQLTKVYKCFILKYLIMCNYPQLEWSYFAYRTFWKLHETLVVSCGDVFLFPWCRVCSEEGSTLRPVHPRGTSPVFTWSPSSLHPGGAADEARPTYAPRFHQVRNFLYVAHVLSSKYQHITDAVFDLWNLEFNLEF